MCVAGVYHHEWINKGGGDGVYMSPKAKARALDLRYTAESNAKQKAYLENGETPPAPYVSVFNGATLEEVEAMTDKEWADTIAKTAHRSLGDDPMRFRFVSRENTSKEGLTSFHSYYSLPAPKKIYYNTSPAPTNTEADSKPAEVSADTPSREEANVFNEAQLEDQKMYVGMRHQQRKVLDEQAARMKVDADIFHSIFTERLRVAETTTNSRSLSVACKDDEPRVRIGAASNRNTSVSDLDEMLTDPDPRVREMAAKTLALANRS
jgi:hypothetical protein